MILRIDISDEEPDSDEPQFLAWLAEKLTDPPNEGAGENVRSCTFEVEDQPMKIMEAIENLLPEDNRTISMMRLIEHIFLAGFEDGIKYANENQ